MLNFIYWPISAILWFWHKAFSFVLSPDSGITWALSIMFLTFTVRMVLVKPMVNTMRSQRKMQDMAPKMQAIREKYKNDQQKMMEETRKLQKEVGVNPIAGCLPMLVQIPVFLGLFHVLRSFNRTGSGVGQLEMTVEQNANTPNYIFGVDEVQSFLRADLFGAPLSSYITMPADAFDAFLGLNVSRLNIALVAAPMILIIVVATHMNARLSVNRQEARKAAGKQQVASSDQMAMQMQMMNKMMLWFMPATILFTGFIWTIGLLVYMMANNVWTFFQQRYIFGKMDAEEAAEEEEKRAAKRTTAPKPGVKPENPKKRKK
ncbi:membrane protein insertase YidC [Corynebacterium glutamicum]|uniref:membrane protein insertase YidC n=1 Tax=Corynebacterium glutamicum TaxID=1718 RepID=UPI0007C60923|nr:membrane protein insertase YidC [Corynebacterium glutamicum]ANE09734.1 membrane protein insertase YidC [Corynebacterium glutamicum]